MCKPPSPNSEARGEGESTDKDAEVASAVRTRLGVADDAGKDEVILAMSVQVDSESRAEVLAMKQRERERIVDERIHVLCRDNVLNPNDAAQIQAARAVALDTPDRFDALVANMRPFVQPGRTTPPDRAAVGRHRTIANAAREYRGDTGHRKLTSLRAFIDLRLREAGEGLLSDDEAAEHAADDMVVA